MIDGPKNSKDFMSIVYETYKDFAENTSIHGLKYTVKSDLKLYEKIFWIVVVLAGLGGAGYMTVLFWTRYTSNPTRTSISSDYAPTTAVSFPAVTICNINRIMTSKIEDLIKTLTIEEDQKEIVHRAIPQLFSITEPSTTNYNITELGILNEVLLKNDYGDIKTVMGKISQSCSEMLVKCRWNFTTIPCNNLFQETLTGDGQCCSFNHISNYLNSKKRTRRSFRTPFSGYHSGLVVLLDPMVQSVQYSSLHAAGMKVIIHSPGDYPGSGAAYKIVSSGRQTHLQISATKIVCSKGIKRLTRKQRQCAYPDEIRLRYFSSYGDTNCLIECEEKYFNKKCDCVPFYYPFTSNPICNITEIPCLDERKESKIKRNCNCLSQCEDEFYEIFSTTAEFDYKNTFPTSSFLVNETISDDSILLYVYFSSQRQTVLFRDTITSTIYLLSSFGGVYSLFLGCSFITIVEIIYYCSFRLIVNLKILARIDKTPAQNKKNHHQPAIKKTNFKLYSRHNELNSWTAYEGNIFLN